MSKMKNSDQKAKQAAYMREYNKWNSERIRAQRRARYYANHDFMLAAQRIYNARPDVQRRMRLYNQDYQQKNRAAILAQRIDTRARLPL